MLLPPIWRGRGKNVPARNRLACWRAVLKAAQSVRGYHASLAAAHLSTRELVEAVRDIDLSLSALIPVPIDHYYSLFSARQPAWRRRPDNRETRSALVLPYRQARTAVESCRIEPAGETDLYSPLGTIQATGDLFRLAHSLSSSGNSGHTIDQAMVVFSGIDAGVLTEAQRDHLWNRFQIPLFEQFVGTDGRVVAAECEVHAGMHIRPEAAVVECLNGEIVLTSLTDEKSPALRILSGLAGAIDHEACDCGRVEPRILQLRRVTKPRAASANG